MATPMTIPQENALRRLCERFHVPFDPAAYRPAFDLPPGWVAGDVGPIYVGVSPEGACHS